MSKEIHGLLWIDRKYDKGPYEPIWYLLGEPDLWRVGAGYVNEGRPMDAFCIRVVSASIHGTEEEAREVAQYLCDLANVRRKV